MSSNQTMEYHVRPWHIYSHSRTCTHSSSCKDLPVWWHSMYATSLIVLVFMRLLPSWLDSSICQTFPAIREILIHCISSAIMEIMILCISSSWIFWSMYILHGDDHLCHILYHGHCTLMYLGLLYAVICRVVSLYYVDWVVGLPFGILHHSTSGMDL